MRPLLALGMIVRDEEKALARTFASVRGYVDVWCIIDTGSVDGTWAVLQNAYATEEGPIVDGERRALRGKLYKYAFEGYAASRNRVLDLLLHDSDGDEQVPLWALSLSADETLHGGERMREFLAARSFPLDETAILVEVRTPYGTFDYPRLLAVGGGWRYEGEIHEMPVHQVDRGRVPTVKVPGCWIEYAPTDPARLGRRLRERDLPLLTKQLAAARDGATRARVIMLLAQTREQIASTIEGDVASASQEMFSAMGWYMFLSMSQDVPAEARRYATWKYLTVAEVLGIYLSRGDGMVPRLAYVLQEDPANYNAAYMLARHVAGVGDDLVVRGDAREGLQAAYRAVKMAKEAVGEKVHDPHGLLWRSHIIAAACARALGHGPAARRSAEAGIEGGGPRDVFEQFLK